MNVVVAQKGSREHFLAARALHRQGHLVNLVADWYAPRSPLLHRLVQASGIGSLQRLMAARNDEIPDNVVRAFRLNGAISRLKEIRALRNGVPYRAYLSTDAAFAQRVANLSLPDHDVFFGYAYASLEAIRVEHLHGKLVLLDQIDPGPPELRIVQAERERWPAYAMPMTQPPDAYYDRLRGEWTLADAILVNSEWTKSLIRTEGVAPEKIDVLPLAFEHNQGPPDDDRPVTTPLKVLWLGTVNLRKGIQYLVEAAQQLPPGAVEITVAGRLDINPDITRSAPDNIRWLGSVPRSQTGDLYRSSDLFVLPTVSDGFALTQLEALAHGLPLVVTPNCADIVEPNVTGARVPPRDPQALADALMGFADNPERIRDMRAACYRRSQDFSISKYAERLCEIVRRRLQLKRETP